MKWIRVEKSSWTFARTLVFFNLVAFYIGRTDHWGIGVNINFYDRSITLEILNLYMGAEIYRELD
jgi:hypothetical protein